jgi:hypothetical protein
MPLSLLLRETVYAFRWGAFHLEPWSHLVQTEEVLIGRARSAFLTHWFGPGLPLNGSFVRIVIDNLVALKKQYFLASASVLPELEGPSLGEPLAGLFGQVAGILLSPTGVLLTLSVMVRNLGYWTKLLVGALGWKVALLPLVFLVGPVGGPILLPIAFMGGVALGIASPPELRSVYALLGSTAKFLIAATQFLKLLMGPRENIANPLLRSILGLFDRLAGLFPFVLAFVAVIVTRIGPLLVPLALQVRPFKELIDQVVDTVTFIFKDIPASVKRYIPVIADRVDFVLVQLSLILPVFEIVFTELFTNLSESLNDLVEKASKLIKGWFTDASTKATAIVMDQPAIRRIRSAIISFGIAARTLSSGSSSPSSSSSKLPSGFPTPHLTKPEDFLRFMGGAPPGGLGAIETLAKIDIKYGGALFEDYLPFSKGAREGVEAAIRPTQVFAGERSALVRQLGQEPKKALAALRVEQLKLRDLLTAVVGRVLPAELRVQMGNLLDTFGKLDKELYGLKVKQQDYPVRDLPDNGKLRPIVHRLVIRGIDLPRADADTFQARLQQALNGQGYPATAPAQGLASAKG